MMCHECHGSSGEALCVFAPVHTPENQRTGCEGITHTNIYLLINNHLCDLVVEMNHLHWGCGVCLPQAQVICYSACLATQMSLLRNTVTHLNWLTPGRNSFSTWHHCIKSADSVRTQKVIQRELVGGLLLTCDRCRYHKNKKKSNISV